MRNLVNRIIQGRSTHEELEYLAGICLQHAIAFMRMLESHGYRIRETKRESEWMELASDCVANLFIRDADGQFIYLQRFFQKLHAIDSDEETVLAIRRLVRHKVRQHLSDLYRQRNPEGAKLIRNIRLTAHRRQEIQLCRDLTGQFLRYANPACTENPHVFRPSVQELYVAANRTIHMSDHLDKTVLSILSFLSEQTERPVEINLMELAQVIRDFRANAADCFDDSHDPLFAGKLQEFAQKVRQLLQHLHLKLFMSYVQKGKLTHQQALAIYLAIEEIAAAMVEGEPPPKNYICLKKYWNDLDRSDYCRTVRSIFEYFIAQLKEQMQRNYREIF